jgi:hypothetical protein
VRTACCLRLQRGRGRREREGQRGELGHGGLTVAERRDAATGGEAGDRGQARREMLRWGEGGYLCGRERERGEAYGSFDS